MSVEQLEHRLNSDNYNDAKFVDICIRDNFKNRVKYQHKFTMYIHLHTIACAAEI